MVKKIQQANIVRVCVQHKHKYIKLAYPANIIKDNHALFVKKLNMNQKIVVLHAHFNKKNSNEKKFFFFK